MRLEEIKNAYQKIQKKYSLPEFEEMNSVFEIGKIKRDSGNLIRDIRRIMTDKTSYFMRLIEVMINPSQAPPIFLILLKEITKEDKKILDSTFSAFMEIELDSYKLNISSTEKEEADLVKKINEIWHKQTTDLNKIINILERNWKQISSTQKQNKGYFN